MAKDIIYRKYAFESKEQFLDKKEQFYNAEADNYIPNSHFIVGKGFLTLEPQETDEEGNITKEEVKGSEYLVEAAWRGLELDENGDAICIEGWSDFRVTPKEPLHMLRGLENYYKLNK